MPTAVFDEHHLLLNWQENAHRVENWRDGEYRDFTCEKGGIIVTPAGVESGWRRHAKSKVIVITMDPEEFERFAADEVGVLLTARQLRDLPRFRDPDHGGRRDGPRRPVPCRSVGHLFRRCRFGRYRRSTRPEETNHENPGSRPGCSAGGDGRRPGLGVFGSDGEFSEYDLHHANTRARNSQPNSMPTGSMECPRPGRIWPSTSTPTSFRALTAAGCTEAGIISS